MATAGHSRKGRVASPRIDMFKDSTKRCSFPRSIRARVTQRDETSRINVDRGDEAREYIERRATDSLLAVSKIRWEKETR